MPDPVTNTPGPSDSPAGRLVPRPPAPARPGQAALFWTVAAALYRRSRQAIFVGVLAAAAVGAGVWFLLPPPVPTAVAKLYIPNFPQTVIVDKHPDPPLDNAAAGCRPGTRPLPPSRRRLLPAAPGRA